MANNQKRKEGNPNEAQVKFSSSLKGLSKDAGGRLLYHGVPTTEMLAYPIQLAALLIGKGRGTIWRAKVRGDLASKNGLISRSELLRYTGATASP